MYIVVWENEERDLTIDKIVNKKNEIRDMMLAYIRISNSIAELEKELKESNEAEEYISKAPSILIDATGVKDLMNSLKSQLSIELDEKRNKISSFKIGLDEISNSSVFNALSLIYYKFTGVILKSAKNMTYLDRILDETLTNIESLISDNMIVDSDLYSDEDRVYATCALISLLTEVDTHLMDISGGADFIDYTFRGGDITPDEHYLSFIDIVSGF